MIAQEPATLSAASYAIDGPMFREHVAVRGGWLILSGLAAGAYSVAPDYSVASAASRVSIVLRPGETTFLARPKEPIGGIALTIAERLCAEVQELRVSIELDLQEFQAVIAVRSPDDTPVAGASVTTPYGRATEIEPGSYRLTGREGGAAVSVQIHAPGYPPTCRLAPPNGKTIQVRVERPAPAQFSFLGREEAAVVPPGEILLPGAGCWLPLTLFSYKLTSSGPQKAEYRIENLPPVGVLSYRVGAAYPIVALSRSLEGLFTIQLPAK